MEARMFSSSLYIYITCIYLFFIHMFGVGGVPWERWEIDTGYNVVFTFLIMENTKPDLYILWKHFIAKNQNTHFQQLFESEQSYTGDISDTLVHSLLKCYLWNNQQHQGLEKDAGRFYYTMSKSSGIWSQTWKASPPVTSETVINPFYDHPRVGLRTCQSLFYWKCCHVFCN